MLICLFLGMGPSDTAMLVVDGDPLRRPALVSLVCRAVNEAKLVASQGAQLGRLGCWTVKDKVEAGPATRRARLICAHKYQTTATSSTNSAYGL